MDYGNLHSAADDGIPYGLRQRCPVCASSSGLLTCGGCKVVSYCGPAHQSAHRSKHKAICNDIKRTRHTFEREEAALRAGPGDMLNPGNPFETGVGNFWAIFCTRDYMRARFAAADALLKVNTVTAVEKALEHLSDMLRLCRSDNLGVRDIIPGLLLRLGREQECYDFIKWFAVVNDKDRQNGNYDWGDETQPYLDIHNADVFEPIDAFRSGAVSLSHLVMLTLLKLRLRLDMEAYQAGFNEFDFTVPDRPMGRLVWSRVRTFSMRQVSTALDDLTEQCHELCRVVNNENPYFWDVLVDEVESNRTLPQYYSPGSMEEAHLVAHQCGRAWEETEDAMV